MPNDEVKLVSSFKSAESIDEKNDPAETKIDSAKIFEKAKAKGKKVSLKEDMETELAEEAKAKAAKKAKIQSSEQAPPTAEPIHLVSFALVVHPLEEKASKEKPLEDENPLKRLRFLVPEPSIPSPTPLMSFFPQDYKQPSMVKLSVEQFTDSLFQTTSSDYSPTPPKEESKGKGIATEEELMTLEDAKAQLTEMKSLADLKAYHEKTKKKLKALSNEELKAWATQLVAYEAKRAKMLEEYNHYNTFRADPLPITKIRYKINNVSKYANMRIERNNQPLSLTVYEKFMLKKLRFSSKDPMSAKHQHVVNDSLSVKPQWAPQTYLSQSIIKDVKDYLKTYSSARMNISCWNRPTFYDDDEEQSIQYKEYLESSSNAIAPVLPTEEPEYSLSIGYEHLSTTPETESDEVIKSSVKNLVQILREYEVTSDNESMCDVPIFEDSSTFDVHSEILSDSNNDDTSSDDDAFEDIKYVEASLVSLEEENDVYQEEKEFDLEDILQIQDVILREKLLSINRLIADIEFLNDNPTPDRMLKSSSSFPILRNPIILFLIQIIHYPNSRLLAIKWKRREVGRLTNIVKKEISDDLTNDPLLEEVDYFLSSDNLIPPGIENIDYDSEGDIHFLEELLSNDSIPFPKNESSNFDHNDDQSFPRSPSKPSDVEFFFDFEPNSGDVISAVKNNIDELNEY
nr:hypothetical protein [Tanacetum cinerariifolium]